MCFYLTHQFVTLFHLTCVDFSLGCPAASFLLVACVPFRFSCFSSNLQDTDLLIKKILNSSCHMEK